MEVENLIKWTYDDVLKFLEKSLGSQKMSTVAHHLNKAFPTWTHLWTAIHNWLRAEHAFTNMQRSIQSFAQLFPSYDEFADTLDQSLTLHEDFWNKVYIRLCAAQRALK